MGAQKLLRGHDASASLCHPQMAPAVRSHISKTTFQTLRIFVESVTCVAIALSLTHWPQIN